MLHSKIPELEEFSITFTPYYFFSEVFMGGIWIDPYEYMGVFNAA